ncbi:hypothetical protein JCM11491_003189 [Sporobolomyces phaffii]
MPSIGRLRTVSSPGETVYRIDNFIKDQTDCVLLSGPALGLESLKCDMYVPPNADRPDPDKFAVTWKSSDSAPLGGLDHELFRITILPARGRTGRYLVQFAHSAVVLSGREGRVSFLSRIANDDETFRLCAETKGFSSSLEFHFRPRPNTEFDGLPISHSQTLGRLQHYASNDVAFVFPSSRAAVAEPRVLWTRSDLLCRASPYFEAMFASDGFVESKRYDPPTLCFDVSRSTTPTARAHTEEDGESKALAAPASEQPDLVLNSEDSDLEDDDQCPVPRRLGARSIRRIPVVHTAYKTFLCFLYYLETRSIRFDTISSLVVRNPATSEKNTRRPLPRLSLQDFVPSCSPKSMYLLADLYEHAPLRQLAFEAWAAQLGSNNALAEYLSDLAATFPDVKRTALDAVLDNWDIVKESDELDALRTEVERGTLEPRKVRALFELFNQLRPI